MKNTLSLTESLVMDFVPCTYHGHLNFQESENDWLTSDIEEGILPEIKDKQGYSLYSDIEYNWIDAWKKECADHVFSFLSDHKDKLKKWGFTLESCSFWSPREYNFQGDSIDGNFEINEKSFEENKKKLRKEIELYIETIRVSSRDGYTSFEPDSYQDIKIDDHAYLWAIMQHEGIIEELTEFFNDYDNFYSDAEGSYRDAFLTACDEFAKERRPLWFKKKAQDEFNEKYNLKLAI